MIHKSGKAENDLDLRDARFREGTGIKRAYMK